MYWLLKSEPTCYSIDDLARDKTTRWDGVRNYQARNNMKSMDVGDMCFFYHSSTKIPAVVGMMRVVELYAPEAEDPTFGCVTVEYEKTFQNPVTLSLIKENPLLQNLALLKQSRLSVMPVTEKEWQEILKMEGGH